MKIVQIKEITAETVTQEVAADIMAAIVWNHFNEGGYEFVVKDAEPEGRLINGGGSCSSVEGIDLNRYRIAKTGVYIERPGNSGVRVFDSGAAIGYYLNDDGTRARNTHMNTQFKYVQTMINHGFFTVENEAD